MWISNQLRTSTKEHQKRLVNVSHIGSSKFQFCVNCYGYSRPKLRWEDCVKRDLVGVGGERERGIGGSGDGWQRQR